MIKSVFSKLFRLKSNSNGASGSGSGNSSNATLNNRFNNNQNNNNNINISTISYFQSTSSTSTNNDYYDFNYDNNANNNNSNTKNNNFNYNGNNNNKNSLSGTNQRVINDHQQQQQPSPSSSPSPSTLSNSSDSGSICSAIDLANSSNNSKIFIAPSCIRYTNSTLNDTIMRINDEDITEISKQILLSNNMPPKLQIVYYDGNYYSINNSHLQIYKQLEKLEIITHVQADLISLETIPPGIRDTLLLSNDDTFDDSYTNSELDFMANNNISMNNNNNNNNNNDNDIISNNELNEILVDETYEFGECEKCTESETASLVDTNEVIQQNKNNNNKSDITKTNNNSKETTTTTINQTLKTKQQKTNDYLESNNWDNGEPELESLLDKVTNST